MGLLADKILSKSIIKTRKEWFQSNPVLGKQQYGFEKETYYYKMGDGVTKWNDLPYAPDCNKNSAITCIPELDMDNNKVTVESATGAYYLDHGVIRLHFTISAIIDKNNINPNTEIAILFNELPKFTCEELKNCVVGTGVTTGFGYIGDLAITNTQDMARLNICVKANQINDYNEEFLSKLIVQDIIDPNNRITINGMASYIIGSVDLVRDFTLNLPSEVEMSDTSYIGASENEDSIFLQIYIILKLVNTDGVRDNNEDITITLPVDMPLIDSLGDTYISGDITTAGVQSVDGRLMGLNNSRNLILCSKSYTGSMDIDAVKYGDITQETVLISGTFLYYKKKTNLGS